MLPGEMFVYPRQTITNTQFTAIVTVTNWVIPALVVAAFLWFTKLPSRVRSETGVKLLTVAVVVVVGQWAIRFFASLVPGGGGLYAVNGLLTYVALPLKILLLVGAVQVLTGLKAQSVA